MRISASESKTWDQSERTRRGRERGAQIAENVFCVRVEGARKNERRRGIKRGKSKKRKKGKKKEKNGIRIFVQEDALIL